MSLTSAYGRSRGNFSSTAGANRPFVDADVADVGLGDLLVERIHQLLVVGVPRIRGEFLVRVVADRVALPRIRLVAFDRLVDLVEPARLPWRDGEMCQHPPRAGLLVDHLARLEHLVLRDEPILRHVGRRIRQQRDLGVAVHVDFFDVIAVFQVVDRLFLAAEFLVPAQLADRLTALRRNAISRCRRAGNACVRRSPSAPTAHRRAPLLVPASRPRPRWRRTYCRTPG